MKGEFFLTLINFVFFRNKLMITLFIMDKIRKLAFHKKAPCPMKIKFQKNFLNNFIVFDSFNAKKSDGSQKRGKSQMGYVLI